MNTMKTIGNRIQNIRLSKDLTQESLADLIDKSPHYISDIERGIKKPNIITLIDIMKALNITPNELFSGTITIENEEITDAISILSELKEPERLFLINIIKEYKKLTY